MPPTPMTWSAPDPREHLGLVALDHELTPERVISAYRHGIFPWPDGDPRHAVPWVCPRRRAILEFGHLRVSRSLAKARRRSSLHFTIDRAFEAVIRACAASPRPGQAGTWITPAMITAYTEVHRRGLAHSIEAWDGDTMVAGLYGVDAGGVFAGESMFHRVDNGSKLCLLHLADASPRTRIDLDGYPAAHPAPRGTRSAGDTAGRIPPPPARGADGGP